MEFPDTVSHLSIQALATPLGALAIVVVLYAIYRQILPHPLPGIPYNKDAARRLLGDAPDMLREVGATRELNMWLVKQVYKLQTPLCQVFVEPFSKPWVLLADSIEAQDIMIRRPEFDRSNFITDGLGPIEDFHARMKTGQAWRRTRSWLQDLMAPTFLNNVVGPVMYDNSLHLVSFWEAKARLANDRAFDVNEDLNHSALDGMLAFVFDRHFGHTALGPQFDALSQLSEATVEVGPRGEAVFPKAPLHEFISALYETVDKIDIVTKSLSPKLAMRWIRQTPSYKKAMNVRRHTVKEQIRGALERFERTGETRTAIEYMLAREKKAAEKQGRQPEYYDPTMIDEIAGQFIAGLHTTSTTIAWTFIYLTRYPEIQNKLRDDLHKVYKEAYAEKRNPTLDELTKLRVPYLEAVLEEALRLHATSVARQANRDTEVLGQRIPKGTNVVLIANGPGFHAPSFKIDEKLRNKTANKSKGWNETDDMHLFRPERWLVPKEGNDRELDFDANAAPQIAFGMGPRSCWGRRFAYLELRMVVTMIIWNFDLLPVSPELADPKASYGIVHRADQCCLRLRRR